MDRRALARRESRSLAMAAAWGVTLLQMIGPWGAPVAFAIMGA